MRFIMFLKLWQDDAGAIISVEWLLLVSLGVFGVVPGVVVLQKGMNKMYEDMAAKIQQTVEGELQRNVTQIDNTNVNNQTVNVFVDYKP